MSIIPLSEITEIQSVSDEYFVDISKYEFRNTPNDIRIKCTVGPTLDRLVAFEQASWPTEEQAVPEELQRRLSAYPDGIFLFSVVYPDGREVDAGQITGSPKNITDPDNINSFENMAKQEINPAAKTFWFTNMALHPDFRGLRLAPLLMAEAILQAESRGFSSVMAGVTCDGYKETLEANEVSDILDYEAKKKNKMEQTFYKAVDYLNRTRSDESIFVSNSDPITDYWPESQTSEGYGVLVWIDLLNNQPQEHDSSEADCAMIPLTARNHFVKLNDYRATQQYNVGLTREELEEEALTDKITAWSHQEMTLDGILSRIDTEFALEKAEGPKKFENFDWGRAVRCAAYTKWDMYYTLEKERPEAAEEALAKLSEIYFKINVPLSRQRNHPKHFMKSEDEGNDAVHSPADFIALQAIEGARSIASELLLRKTRQACIGKNVDELHQLEKAIESQAKETNRRFVIAHEANAKETLDKSELSPFTFDSGPLETWTSRYTNLTRKRLEIVRQFLDPSLRPTVLRGDNQKETRNRIDLIPVQYSYDTGRVTNFSNPPEPRQTKTGLEITILAAIPQAGCPKDCAFCSIKHVAMGELVISSQEMATALGVNVGDRIVYTKALQADGKPVTVSILQEGGTTEIALDQDQVTAFNAALARQHFKELDEFMVEDGPNATETLVIFNGGNPMSPREVPREFWDMLPEWTKKYPRLKNIETEASVDYFTPSKDGIKAGWKEAIIVRLGVLQSKLTELGKNLRVRLAFEYMSVDTFIRSNKVPRHEFVKNEDLIAYNKVALARLDEIDIKYLGYAMLGGVINVQDDTVSVEDEQKEFRLFNETMPLDTVIFALENGCREAVVNSQYFDPIDQAKIRKREKDFYVPGAKDMSVLIRNTVDYLRTLTTVLPEERGRLRVTPDGEDLIVGTIGPDVPEEFRQLVFQFNNAPDQVAFYDGHREAFEKYDRDEYKGGRASRLIA